MGAAQAQRCHGCNNPVCISLIGISREPACFGFLPVCVHLHVCTLESGAVWVTLGKRGSSSIGGTKGPGLGPWDEGAGLRTQEARGGQ